MKANEFRIGNWINHTWIDVDGSCKTMIQVAGVFQNQVIVNDNSLPNYTHIQNPIPIPLTEEWLLKFGFKSGTQYPIWLTWHIEHEQLNHLSFYLCHSKKKDYLPMCMWGHETISIQYVHELQSLYFVLTGEELTLNNPVQ